MSINKSVLAVDKGEEFCKTPDAEPYATKYEPELERIHKECVQTLYLIEGLEAKLHPILDQRPTVEKLCDKENVKEEQPPTKLLADLCDLRFRMERINRKLASLFDEVIL